MAAAAQSGDAGESLRQAAVHGWSDVGALLDQQLLGAPGSGLDVTVGGLIAAVLAIALTWLVSVLVRRALHRFGGREGVNQEALYALSRVLHYILLLVGILLALDFAGVELGKFALFASAVGRSEEHTSELQSLMRISYAVFSVKKKTTMLTVLNQAPKNT